MVAGSGVVVCIAGVVVITANKKNNALFESSLKMKGKRLVTTEEKKPGMK